MPHPRPKKPAKRHTDLIDCSECGRRCMVISGLTSTKCGVCGARAHTAYLEKYKERLNG